VTLRTARSLSRHPRFSLLRPPSISGHTVLPREHDDAPGADPAPAPAALAPTDLSSADTLDPRRQVNATIARYFFGSVAAGALAGVVIQLLAGPVEGHWNHGLAAAFAALALGSAWATRLRDRHVPLALAAVAIGVVSLVTAGTVLHQWGLSSVALGLFGLVVAALTAVTTVGTGLGVAAWCVLLLLALAAGEQMGWIAGPPAAGKPIEWRLTLQLVMVGGGVACGLLLAHVITLYVRASHAREQRFVGLLGIAADAYWELDARYGLTHVAHRQADGSFVADEQPPLAPPWELPCLLFDDDALDALRADLEAREPFRDRALQWRDGTALRHLSVSGEPRFDHRGVFLGYWGVARDVTADVAARAALAITETRYRELFRRLPTPLVLHRRGRILDANPAAVTLFGYRDLPSMLGHHLDAHTEAGPAREAMRAALLQMESMPVGQAMEPTELHVVSLDNQHMLVLASAVRVASADGPATLVILVDETERASTEAAVRRSEALLSHLVATSPDVVTLTDLKTGRYVMVNESFEQVTGYTREEVIGRSALEIGVWADPAEREHLLRALQADGAQRNWPCTFVTKEGRPVQMVVSAARFEMDGRDYVVLSARDVTAVERARLEREAIVANASIGIALTRDQTFQLVNPAFEEMLGWPPGELVGKPARIVWPSDEDYARIGREYGPALARGERVEIDAEVARRDGSRIVCRMLARAVDPHHPSKGGTVWITEDVTEQRQLMQALAKARDDAEAANRAKSAFLANTSHEIRTPLNALLNLTQMARRADIDDAQRCHYLDLIADSAEALAPVISDILDLSKIEAGKLDVEHVPFDLHHLLHTLQRGYAKLAEGYGLALTLAIADDVPQAVVGDPTRVRQILQNYVSNALKFTPRGGSVRVAAQLLDGGGRPRVLFEVHDTGPGIDPAVQARLFAPFMQADQSTTRRFGGTGLGLSICRELARLMGGEVGVDSRPGAGSRFWAELPLELAPEASHLTGFGTLEERPLAGARVLVVEDNDLNQLIAGEMLRQWGIDVTAAANGRLALEAVERAHAAGRPFDAVLMDLQMPEMDGYEAARRLRQRADTRQLPIIAFTAAALAAERDKALDAGMNDFTPKPADRTRLFEVLRRWLRR
jgi:PAS domain S-box-containing protein